MRLTSWGRVRLGRAAERPGSPWPVRSALDRLDLAASSALCRPTWSFCRSNLLVRASPGRPGLRFSSPKRLFFRSFCVPRTFDAQNVQHRKNIVKTSTKRTSELLCIEPKSIKNVLRGSRKAFTNTNALNERLGSLQANLGSVLVADLECSWAVLEHPGSSRERSWGVLNASLAVLGASRLLLEALLNRSGDAPIPQDRFWTDFGSILVRF